MYLLNALWCPVFTNVGNLSKTITQIFVNNSVKFEILTHFAVFEQLELMAKIAIGNTSGVFVWIK